MNLAIQRISAIARQLVLNLSKDLGHNVLSAEDIYAALHYGNGMKNSVIAVAQAEEKNINWDKKFQRLHNIIPLSMTLIW